MTYGSVKGFENADTIYCGFTTSADKLMPMNITNAQSMGWPFGILATDLRSIVFRPADKEPISVASFD